jgi:UDP-glucuronate decarboxylase
MNCDHNCTPINIGNPQEFTIKEFADIILGKIAPGMAIKHLPPTQDDPKKRRPDITRAGEMLNWAPRMDVRDGIEKTILYFKHELALAKPEDAAAPTIWVPEMVDRLPARK